MQSTGAAAGAAAAACCVLCAVGRVAAAVVRDAVMRRIEIEPEHIVVEQEHQYPILYT